MGNHSLPKILVVDDHAENLIAMRHVLKRIQGEIICVESGNDALKELLRNEFSVVLMDVQMPEMNGFETAEIIRSNESTQSLPIIFLTAINKEKKYVKRGYELGAVDYLFKPFDPEVLRFKVSVFLELSNQRGSLLALAKKNQLILDSVSEGVIGLDNTGNVIFANPSACRLLKTTFSKLENTPAQKFIAIYKNKEWEETELYKSCIDSVSHFKTNLRFINKKNVQFPAECKATAMHNKNNKIEGFVLVFDDISARLNAEKQLIKMAENDALTGLPNRRLFYQILPKAIDKSKRLKYQVALLFIDIDHFKSINDTLGHITGDLLLTQFAMRLQNRTRSGDTVVRLSGDEFVVLLEGIKDSYGVIKFAKNIITDLKLPFIINNNKVFCTASIGVSISSDSATDANELIKAADAAMYNVKENGRNGYQLFDKNLNQRISFRTQIESQLKLAIEADEFHLNYQPKVKISTGELIGVEALIRWNSTTLGIISPAKFIPIAEDCGLINEIGLMVLTKACNQYQQWKDNNVISEDFCVSVNLSTKQLNHPSFLLSMDEILKATNMDPSKLDIEITESTLMSNTDTAIPLLRVLSQMGMTISIDDFGTGYSSLSYLRILPLNYLKIDQSFIKDLFTDMNSDIITRSIINLAHNLGLGVVAEGVETQEQAEFLKHHQCDIGQGYFYSKPVSAEAISQLSKKLT